MPYFSIATGLRGCYMPDNVFVIKCDTRRELKAAIEDEARYVRDAGFNGANKKGVAWIANAAWKVRRKPPAGDFALPYGYGKNRAFGIFVSVSTRTDYLAQEND